MNDDAAARHLHIIIIIILEVFEHVISYLLNRSHCLHIFTVFLFSFCLSSLFVCSLSIRISLCVDYQNNDCLLLFFLTFDGVSRSRTSEGKQQHQQQQPRRTMTKWILAWMRLISSMPLFFCIYKRWRISHFSIILLPNCFVKPRRTNSPHSELRNINSAIRGAFYSFLLASKFRRSSKRAKKMEWECKHVIVAFFYAPPFCVWNWIIFIRFVFFIHFVL